MRVFHLKMEAGECEHIGTGFKGLVHSKIKMMSFISHPHVVPNP